jgi:hypothetical protein
VLRCSLRESVAGSQRFGRLDERMSFLRLFSSLLFLAAASAIGCSGSPSAPVDAGSDAASVAPDAGAPSHDASVPRPDAAPSTDAGMHSDVGTDAAAPLDARVTLDTNPDDAGLPCAIATDCGDTSMFFCDFPVGTCGGAGTCARYGGSCPLFFRPVCACNGHTYSNATCAQQAGQSLRDAMGACTITPTCGCMHDVDCHVGDECVITSTGGVCKTPVLARPMCWRDEDCATGETCSGESVCQCGAGCLVADHTGTCG